MKLRNLQISVRPSYHANAGEYYGTIEFENTSGKVEININAEYCNRILSVTAEQIVSTARKVASELTASCIEQVIPLLESNESSGKQLPLDIIPTP